MGEAAGVDNPRNLREGIFGRSLEQQFIDVESAWRDAFYVGGATETSLALDANTTIGFGISDKPIRVPSIRNCCNVNLVGNTYSAATHYPETGYLGTNFDPEQYLPKAIEALRGKGEDKFFATVVGGDRQHFERILKVLKSQRIPIAGKYRDGEKTDVIKIKVL
ncbi:MAG: hypothetical protein Q7S45_05200 [Candidatus Curtissbacteria bacterium]|nr:hypothetical protein [Candidatus Curtissbacteria bacterium]